MANNAEGSNDTGMVLEKLYNRLVISSDDNDRIRINDSIITIIDGYVISDSLFSHNFANLRYLGQITSPDSVLKIITWNLVLKNEPGRYFCYFIRKQDRNNNNLIYRLTSTYRESNIFTDREYFESDWYGALYYDVKPFSDVDQKYWILLGIDYGNPLITRKVIEVLSFSEDGSVLFGKRLFLSGEELKFREVFEYGSGGMMSLRFGSGKSIFFDHLVPYNPLLKNDRQFYGSDYSYDAYYLENGIWKLNINIDARNKE